MKQVFEVERVLPLPQVRSMYCDGISIDLCRVRQSTTYSLNIRHLESVIQLNGPYSYTGGLLEPTVSNRWQSDNDNKPYHIKNKTPRVEVESKMLFHKFMSYLL